LGDKVIQPDIVMGSEQAGVDERRGTVVVTSMSS
jgi:hypothetical protein